MLLWTRIPGIRPPLQVLLYALRWAAAWLALELLTHMLYFNSVAKYRLWAMIEQRQVAVQPIHYAIGSLWVLVFMWLKVRANFLSWSVSARTSVA